MNLKQRLITKVFRKGRELWFGNDGNNSVIEPDGTLRFDGNATVWDDIRINPGSFDRPGSSDPAFVSVQPGGSGTATFMLEFALNNLVSFFIQLPHSYKQGTNIEAHVHWTPGNRGNEENGNKVGWKIDYTWAGKDTNFSTMQTLDLSSTCSGVDWRHERSPGVIISGTGKTISSMLICNLKRTDTGTDDTWVGTLGGQLPLILEVDFHFEIDTIGSRLITAK